MGGAGTDQLYRPPLVSQFDDGPDRTRRRGFFSSTVLNITIDVTLTTLPLFQDFVQDDLRDGTMRFTGPVLLPNGVIATRTCRISGPTPLKWLGPLNPQLNFPLTVWRWRA